MRIRGERACRDCNTRWSYYETGSVNCPSCGSIRSRGIDDERALHTEGPGTLDLTAVRNAVDDQPLGAVVDEAKAACRAYLRQDGFVSGGDLRPLDDAHLAARELVHVADLVGRSAAPSEDAELYLFDLLAGADGGDRPEADVVPDDLRGPRGLAAAESVRAYRREVLDWLEDDPHPAVREPLGRLDQHARRVVALEGDVDQAVAERLVEIARSLSGYLREDDEAALAAASDRLDRLDEREAV